MLCLVPGPPGFNCSISFTLVFSCIYCLVFIFALYVHFVSPFYLLGDDASIS